MLYSHLLNFVEQMDVCEIWATIPWKNNNIGGIITFYFNIPMRVSKEKYVLCTEVEAINGSASVKAWGRRPRAFSVAQNRPAAAGQG
jgi:hypothetical protein